MTIAIAIVDDHKIFVDTLHRALDGIDDFTVVATANDGAAGIAAVIGAKPDVALLDIELPDAKGTDLVSSIREASPDTRFLMITGSTDIGHFSRAMNEGVAGYLLKTAPFEQVCDAIRAAAGGRTIVPHDVVDRLVSVEADTDGIGSDLSPRERDVLQLLAEGLDHKAVAATLHISWHTARSYVKNILAKLGAHSQLEAVAVAQRNGLLKREEDA